MGRGPIRYPFSLWFLYPAVLISGATALVYEIVWARRLALILGSATSAASAVIAAFMFGLAVGAVLVGWRADSSRRPLRWYGILELGIGIYAIAFDSLLELCRGMFATQPWLCAFALLSMPAALMGGTLPVLSRAAADTTERGTRAFGSLYGVNTLGAVLGSLLAALVLLEALGLAGAARLAAIVNIVLGVLFWVLGMAAGKREIYAPPEEEAPRTGLLGDAEPRIVLAFFLAGFAALGLEMAWFRLLVYYLEGFTIAFGLMLAAYLLALGAGAIGGTGIALIAKNPRRLLARVLLVEAVLALATLLFATPLGDQLEEMREGYTRAAAIDAAYSMQLFWMALAIVFPATFCAGMLMPIVARIALSDREAIGRHTGAVYAASTFGAVLAPPVAAFWLLPALGVPQTIALFGVLLLLAGTAVAFVRGLREWAFAGGAAVVFVALCLAAGLGTPLVKRSHVFRSEKPRRLLHASPGQLCDVSVVEELTDGSRRLYLDGFSAAETSPHYGYMRMQGHLPVLLHPQPERALVIAFGTGTTAGAVSAHPEVKEIVCVEIEPRVYDVTPYFAEQNREVLGDARTKRIVADGRALVARTARRIAEASKEEAFAEAFDLITLEPLMPYTPAAVHFYTKDFYELARDSLRPGGILCQWIPPQGVSGEDCRRLIASVAAAFDHVSVWYFRHAVLVLGSDAAPVLDGAAFLKRSTTPAVLADLQIAAVGDAAHLLGSHVASGRALQDALNGAEPMVDDEPYLEFRPLARGLGRRSVECHAEVLEFLRDHHQASLPWAEGVIPGVDVALATGRAVLDTLAREQRWRVDPDAEGTAPPRSGALERVLETDRNALFARTVHDRRKYVELMQAGRVEEAAQLSRAPDRSLAYLALAGNEENEGRLYYLTLAVGQNGLLDPKNPETSVRLLEELAQALDGPERRFCLNRARYLRGEAFEEGEERRPTVRVPDIVPALDEGDEEAARVMLERARQADLGEQVDRAAWEWYEAIPDKRAAFRMLVAIGSDYTLRAAARLVRSPTPEDLIAVAPFYCSRYPTYGTWADLCRNPNAQVREAAAEAAKVHGTRDHLAQLLELCRDANSGVRLSAFISFREIDPRADETGYDPEQPAPEALEALAVLAQTR